MTVRTGARPGTNRNRIGTESDSVRAENGSERHSKDEQDMVK